MAFLCDLRQSPRIVQYRTGTKHVLIPGLVVVIAHEQRRAVSLQKSLLPDIGIRVVNESAGLDISICVNVAVAPSSRDAAAHILSVVPEVYSKQRLRLAVLPDLVVHHLPLLCRCHQLFLPLLFPPAYK